MLFFLNITTSLYEGGIKSNFQLDSFIYNNTEGGGKLKHWTQHVKDNVKNVISGGERE